jgi:hypothetical protein
MAVRFIFMALPVLILLLFAVIAVIIPFIKLCSKRPLVGAIMLLTPLVLFASYFALRLRPDFSSRAEVFAGISSAPSNDPAATIWLPGIEDQFEANIYPSEFSAVRSLGLRIGAPVRQVIGENSPSRIILFQGAHERGLMEDFGKAISKTFPDVNWAIALETAAVKAGEVGIRLDVLNVQTHPAPWVSGSETEMTSGTVQATVLAGDSQASIIAGFVDKPWVEDFSGFLNARPNSRFIIAKSEESCTTEAEANKQAEQNACVQVADRLSTSLRGSGVRGLLVRPVDSADLLDGGFIVDRFVQSFNGAAGRIWRQALLIDASAGKLAQLAHRKAAMARARKTGLARMLFSIVGFVVLITVVYAFLNAATKGYYVWSLRIAGIVLALVVIILLLV